MYIRPHHLALVFTCKEEQALSDKRRLVPQDLGTLHLPTGKIVANDPLALYQIQPFLTAVPPGEYPVRLFVQHDLEQDDRRVALACLYFSAQPAVRWEMALTSPEQDPATLGADSFYGYGVDAGTGGFMDESAALYLDELGKNNREAYDMLMFEELPQQMDKTYRHTYSTLNHTVGDTHNVVCFSSGWGDGSYPSYFGYSENGAVCALVTDFCILEE